MTPKATKTTTQLRLPGVYELPEWNDFDADHITREEADFLLGQYGSVEDDQSPP